MSSAEYFRKMFKGATLEVDDLFLLEPFQIAYLPGLAPDREFAAVLTARPGIKKFLVARCPSVAGFIETVLRRHPEAKAADELAECCDSVVWTIADLLLYDKCPEVYDRLPFHNWDFSEVTCLVSLTGKVVIDAGAGTGRVALEAAETAAAVFAVEPVSRLREFIREKAERNGLSNLHVIDGFLHSLPFPHAFADVLITSHALRWRLVDELTEFERVVRESGQIIHCPGTADNGCEEDKHRTLIAPRWGYQVSTYQEDDGPKRRYWKHLKCVTSNGRSSTYQSGSPEAARSSFLSR